MEVRLFSAALVTGFSVAALPVLPVAVSEERISGGDSVDSAPELAAGSLGEPERYTLEVTGQDWLYFDVDIPVGQRLHVAYTLDPDQAPAAAEVAGELIDARGYLSDYDALPTSNEDSGAGLRSGFVISEPMNAAHRSYGQDTLLRLAPSGGDFPVELSVSVIPEVVDGGALAEIDRPPLRYADDVEPVVAGPESESTPGEWFGDAGEVSGTTRQRIEAGQTQMFRVPLGWLQAIDATAEILEPAAGDGTLSVKMFNAAEEQLTLVGEWEIADDHDGQATFGQRSPAHHKNLAAKNKSRTTGFLGEYVYLAVTYTGAPSGSVDYRLAVQPRGEAASPGPAFDAAAAEAAQADVEPVDKEMYYAAGFEEPAWRQAVANPLLWAAGGAVVLALVIAAVAIRRR
ncbi:hypothetical protein [Corynebacterium sp.]|uniref:hypothetical protein n=1 Tax=Corynebacterium sp. TaxID=1720 RepID=UPI003735C49C